MVYEYEWPHLQTTRNPDHHNHLIHTYLVIDPIHILHIVVYLQYYIEIDVHCCCIVTCISVGVSIMIGDWDVDLIIDFKCMTMNSVDLDNFLHFLLKLSV